VNAGKLGVPQPLAGPVIETAKLKRTAMKYLLPDQTGTVQVEDAVGETARAPGFDKTFDPSPEENHESPTRLQQAAARGRRMRESARRMNAAMRKVRTRKKQ
jgi:hypothetical protein